MALDAPSLKWYAVQVTPKHEHSVATVLSYKGHENFYPTIVAKHRWSDRTKMVIEPLFPGYLFSRVCRSSIAAILQTAGVLRVISFGGKPVAVADDEIESVKIALRSGRMVSTSPYVAVGQQVEVVYGPLMGLRGLVTRVKHNTRIAVSVESIMKSISIELEASDVCIVGGNSGTHACKRVEYASTTQASIFRGNH